MVHNRKKDSGGIFIAAMNTVSLFHQFFRLVSSLAAPGIQIEAGVVGTGYRDAHTMALVDHNARRPEVDLYLIDFSRFE